jgi:hypothetical protein
VNDELDKRVMGDEQFSQRENLHNFSRGVVLRAAKVQDVN